MKLSTKYSLFAYFIVRRQLILLVRDSQQVKLHTHRYITYEGDREEEGKREDERKEGRIRWKEKEKKGGEEGRWREGERALSSYNPYSL